MRRVNPRRDNLPRRTSSITPRRFCSFIGRPRFPWFSGTSADYAWRVVLDYPDRSRRFTRLRWIFAKAD
jgi:hypothetical protein